MGSPQAEGRRAWPGLERADSESPSGNTSTEKGNNLPKVIAGPAAEPGIKSRCAELVLGLYSHTWVC